MAGKLIPSIPVTQTIDSGKALAKFLGLAEETPGIISLANGARLVLSSKRDCYYVATAKSCSCRAGQFGKVCKHRRPLLGAEKSAAELYQEKQRARRAAAKTLSPVDSIMPREEKFVPCLE
jgi:hypothetical protein